MEIPLQGNEKIIKIKAKFDRTCVITDEGNAYIWGGEDLSHLTSEPFRPHVYNLREDIGH